MSNFIPVLCAVGATMLFSASAGLDSVWRGLCFAGGIALLALAIIGIARLRTADGSPGWLPSRGADSQEESGEQQDR